MNYEARSRASVWIPAAILLAAAPLAVVYLTRLWAVPHYQFFPVLMIAVAGILWQRWGDLRAQEKQRGTSQGSAFSVALIWLGLVIEAAAISLFSPWLGYIAFIVIGAGLLWHLTGRECRRFLAAWALLLLVVRPPLEQDLRLISWLQHSTARQSSAILDVLNADHIREGVLIQIPGRTLFVEEACSGVQSLFSLIAMAGLMVVWNRRPALWSLLLFGAAAVGAAAMNIVRTVTIVCFLDRYKVDLLLEPQHTLLGLGVFVGSLVWLMCFDMLLAFLLSPMDGDDARTENAWIALWNRWIGGLRPAASRAASAIPSAKRHAGLTAAMGVGALLCVAALWTIGSAARAAAAEQVRIVPEGEQPIVDRLKEFNEASAPENLDGWERDGYTKQERNIRSMFGDVSHTWKYRTPYGIASCSVDFPFLGWHDLRLCYQGIGWQLLKSEAYSAADEKPSRMHMTLQKSSGENGYVTYGLVGPDLKPFSIPESNVESHSLMDRLTFIVKDASTAPPVTYQFQVMATSNTPLLDEEKADVDRHFELFRNAILSQLEARGAK